MTSTTASTSTQILSGIWEVRCVRCGKEIGTMSSAILMGAIRFAQDKGGVMCPGCRALACKICGEELHGFAGTSCCWGKEGTPLEHIAEEAARELGAETLSSSLNLNEKFSACYVNYEYSVGNTSICEKCERMNCTDTPTCTHCNDEWPSVLHCPYDHKWEGGPE